MTSFVKHIAVGVAALVTATAWSEKSSDNSTPKPDGKDAGAVAKKDKKKNKNAKPPEDPNAPKKTEVPVIAGHPSKGLIIPYYDSSGKHQMQFKIGVATRLDDNHVEFTDLDIETFNEQGEHEMQIDMPTSVMDTDTSVITTQHHVVIRRSDFELTGNTMIFNTRTKQGGLGGNVHMTIYNLEDETSGPDNPPAPKGAARSGPAKVTKPALEPDSFKTPASRSGESGLEDKADKFMTPGSK